jgi:predicted ArsR family transcriptional regulator
MDEVQREKEHGFDLEYLAEAVPEIAELGDRHKTPGFGLAAQLFACTAKVVLERLGPEEGEKVLKEAVEEFGLQRGRRIAERVKADGKPLTFRNWLIYGDIDTARNFSPEPAVDNNDLVVKVNNCTFSKAAEQWGLGEFADIYCRYVDYAILHGYNPDVKLEMDHHRATGNDHCVFRYIMKEANK